MEKYYYGTSAYKLDEYESYAEESNKRQEERKETAKATGKATYRFATIIVLFVFIAASALVYINVMAIRAATEKEKLQKQYALLVDDNKQKEMEISRKVDIKVIEKKAVDELGMQKPDNSQIVYVNVKKENSEVVVNAAPAEEDSLWDSVKGWFSDVWEYFS